MFSAVQNIQETIHILCDNTRLSLEAKSVNMLKAAWYFGTHTKPVSVVMIECQMGRFHYNTAVMVLV
jgi:hypothetical protein